MGLGTKEHTYAHTRTGTPEMLKRAVHQLFLPRATPSSGLENDVVGDAVNWWRYAKKTPHSQPRMSALIHYVVLPTPNPVYLDVEGFFCLFFFLSFLFFQQIQKAFKRVKAHARYCTAAGQPSARTSPKITRKSKGSPGLTQPPLGLCLQFWMSQSQ